MSSNPICGILTVSDSCFNGEKQDTSGPNLEKSFIEAFPNYKIVRDLVPDSLPRIVEILNKWICLDFSIILTTGGTGFSPRDVTPEATKMVIEREAPGIAYAMTFKSLEVTPMAMLSRAICGIKNKTLIINLPGSAKGATECFSFIQVCVPHAVALIRDDKAAVDKVHKRVQFVDECTPSKVSTKNVAERPRESLFPMLELEEATNLLQREADFQVSTEKIRIEEGLFRVLAEDVLSYDDVPPFDASMKDGYAVRTCDLDAPRRVRSALGAGDAPERSPLQEGEAIRIGTGAPIPRGADAVVQVEDTSVIEQQNGEEIVILVKKAPHKGQDIRLAGCDVAKNSVVLSRGERLKASHIGVLAAVGKSEITVNKRASIGIFTTGNELKEHYEKLELGQIRDSNRLALINLLKEYHYECEDYGIVQDDPDTIKKAIARALTLNDILVTTGGVSMGEFDYIKRVLIEDFNATIHFGRVNIKPGKPTTFATLNFEGTKKIVFGLPGNPVSACVMCLLFVVPMLRLLEGENEWQFPTIPYIVSTSKPSLDARPEYVRAIVSYVDGKIVAKPNGGQISSRLNSLVGANGLLFIPGSIIPNREYVSHIILLGNILPM